MIVQRNAMYGNDKKKKKKKFGRDEKNLNARNELTPCIMHSCQHC